MRTASGGRRAHQVFATCDVVRYDLATHQAVAGRAI